MTLLWLNPICDPDVLVQLVTSLKNNNNKERKIKGRPTSIWCSRLAARSLLDHCFPVREVRASLRQGEACQSGRHRAID